VEKEEAEEGGLLFSNQLVGVVQSPHTTPSLATCVKCTNNRQEEDEGTQFSNCQPSFDPFEMSCFHLTFLQHLPLYVDKRKYVAHLRPFEANGVTILALLQLPPTYLERPSRGVAKLLYPSPRRPKHATSSLLQHPMERTA
jgi:hypothetical protein